jgi:hypothetical protein
MRKDLSLVLSLGLILCGCATGKMVLVNPEKTAREIKEDEALCNVAADTAGAEDATLRQKEFNRCMQGKGYKLVSEKETQNVKGFKQSWVNPDTDFKTYEVIFIEKVDVSEVKVKNMQVPGTKVSDEDIDSLGRQMQERFSKILNTLVPVVPDRESIAGRKALYISLKLKDIAWTNVGFNAALQVVSQLSRLPIPVSSKGLFSFQGEISDFSSKENLISVSDESKSDKNASLAGWENFERWKHAYNTMDYWADCLAILLAQKRGQQYKSQLSFKLVDF